jgi:hypothetical protein
MCFRYKSHGMPLGHPFVYLWHLQLKMNMYIATLGRLL